MTLTAILEAISLVNGISGREKRRLQWMALRAALSGTSYDGKVGAKSPKEVVETVETLEAVGAVATVEAVEALDAVGVVETVEACGELPLETCLKDLRVAA